MTTEKFKTMKAKYIAEHGYTVELPSMSEIIHVKKEKEITADEESAWKRKDWSAMSVSRREEIKKVKAKKKERFLRMLGSPTPHVVNNIGSIMTSLDDAQDALTTLSVIGRIAIKFAPRMLAKSFLGPVGWVLLAADVINLVMELGRLGLKPKIAKRKKDGITKNNPFTKKAKVMRAKKLMKAMPTKGNLIEVAQTTDQIFGVGVCLGPIVGAVNDVAFGTMRMLDGEKVTCRSWIPECDPWTSVAQKMQKSATLYLASGYMEDDDQMMEVITAYYLSSQELLVGQKDWNPLEHIVDIAKTEVQAPRPTNFLTREVMEEEGLDPDKTSGWLHNNKTWGSTEDIANIYDKLATANAQEYMQRHEHDDIGYTFGSLMSDSAFYTLGNLEGEDACRYDYTAESKFASIMLDNGYTLAENTPEDKKAELGNWLEFLERQGPKPTLKYIKTFCALNNIELVKF